MVTPTPGVIIPAESATLTRSEAVMVNTGETGTDQALLGLGAAASSLGLAGLIGFRKRNRS